MPTATHREALGHVTPCNAPLWFAGGAGACWSDHVLPFQCSTSGAEPKFVTAEPTATQSPAVRQCTLVSELFVSPSGCRFGIVDQCAPFQRSAEAMPKGPPAAW